MTFSEINQTEEDIKNYSEVNTPEEIHNGRVIHPSLLTRKKYMTKMHISIRTRRTRIGGVCITTIDSQIDDIDLF